MKRGQIGFRLSNDNSYVATKPLSKSTMHLLCTHLNHVIGDFDIRVQNVNQEHEIAK